MNLPQKILSAAVFVAVLGAPALAQTPQATPSPAAAAHKPITPEQRSARFDKADANHDGKLTKVEFTASLKGERAAKADKIWAHLSPAGKDSVTKAEFLAVPAGHGKGAAKAN